MPFDKELWKHSSAQTFEQHAESTEPFKPLEQQQVLTITLQAAIKQECRAKAPEAPASKPKLLAQKAPRNTKHKRK